MGHVVCVGENSQTLDVHFQVWVNCEHVAEFSCLAFGEDADTVTVTVSQNAQHNLSHVKECKGPFVVYEFFYLYISRFFPMILAFICKLVSKLREKAVFRGVSSKFFIFIFKPAAEPVDNLCVNA